MHSYEAFEHLITTLESICGGFVIKDFVGFLNWEPTLGALLLRHTGHRSPFCQSVKQNPDAYTYCSVCSQAHQRYCCRSKEPFTRSCYLGISEYSVPILIGQQCIGSISAGHYCTDPAEAQSRRDKFALRFGLNTTELEPLFQSSVSTRLPSHEALAVFDFVAAFLAEQFRPFVDEPESIACTSHEEEDGFELIRTYICNNYTSPNICVASIAEACHYSPSYISHTFKKRMKINVRTYINQLRILLAKHELSQGSSVSYAAMICGFNDANYFSSVFHSMVGIPPSRYAKHSHKDTKIMFKEDYS